MSDIEESFGIQRPKIKRDNINNSEILKGRYEKLISNIPPDDIRLAENVRAKLSKVKLGHMNPCMIVAGAIYLVKYEHVKSKGKKRSSLEKVNKLCENYIYDVDAEFNGKMKRPTKPSTESVLKDIYRAYRYILNNSNSSVDTLDTIDANGSIYTSSDNDSSNEWDSNYESDN